MQDKDSEITTTGALIHVSHSSGLSINVCYLFFICVYMLDILNVSNITNRPPLKLVSVIKTERMVCYDKYMENKSNFIYSFVLST